MAVFCNVKGCRSVWYRPRWRAPRAGGSARSARALAVYPLNTTGRLIYRVHHARRRRNDKRKGVTETDCARLLDATHQQLAGPIVMVWDNLNVHISDSMTGLVAARDWLTACRLPPYAHELNPVEPVWSHLKDPWPTWQTQPHPAHRPDQDPAQADAVPARPARRLPRQLRPGPHTLL